MERPRQDIQTEIHENQILLHCISKLIQNKNKDAMRYDQNRKSPHPLGLHLVHRLLNL